VPGGGLTLLRAIDAHEPLEQECEGDERTGVQILKHALENAVSVAGTLLLTEATLTEVKDERVDKLQAELAGM
jgi:hypothetical protein